MDAPTTQRPGPARSWRDSVPRRNVFSLLVCFCFGIWLLWPTSTDREPHAFPVTPERAVCDSNGRVRSVAIVGELLCDPDFQLAA